jgi:hypothetical protein
MAEEGVAPEVVVALRAELGLCKSERGALQEELRSMKVKEQLLLTRVAELEAKYEVCFPCLAQWPGVRQPSSLSYAQAITACA